MTDKKGSNVAAYGLFAGAGAIGFVAVILVFGGSFGGGTQPGTMVCDITGFVSGTVNDYNEFNRSVTNLVISMDKGNCHEKGILEFSAAPTLNDPQPAALYTPGHVTIYVKLYQGQSNLVKTETFTVTTNAFEPVKNFNQPIAFKTLPAGGYLIKVTSSWSGDSTIGTPKQITIS